MPETRRRRTRPADPGVEVAASIRSLSDAAGVFVRFGSPRVLAVGVLAALVLRIGVAVAGVPGEATVGLLDVVAIGVVAALVPFVEWFVHRFVLHIRPRRVGRFLLDPGVGHREHHDNPSSVNWVVLRGVDAGVFLVINALVAVAVVGGPLWLAGAVTDSRPPVLGPAMTAVVAAAVALSHYEWSHFLFHTAYRPRTARYRRLKANHRRHHWRDEHAWLGITSNLADRVLRTLPSSARR